jgi:glutamyl/glutaminyl-tRNA synthetase
VHRAIDSRFDAFLPLFKERMTFGGDFIWQAEPFYADSVSPHADDLLPKGLDRAQARALLEVVQLTLKNYAALDQGVWDAPNLERVVRTMIEERSRVVEGDSPENQALAKLWQPKALFMVMRVAVTGKRESPPLFDTLAQLGSLKVIERLGIAQQKLR